MACRLLSELEPKDSKPCRNIQNKKINNLNQSTDKARNVSVPNMRENAELDILK